MLYYSHGLSINSTFPFPEMKQGYNKSDVEVHYGTLEVPISGINFEKELDGIKILIKNRQTYFIWNNICFCRISNGKEIIINNSIEIEENLLKTLILGPVFATLLHQLGRLVLHASAVNINNSAIAFLGPRGRGKSTTSLALCKNGYDLLSDDVLSIDIDKNVPLVFPSYPRIKLYPEVIKNIKEDPYSMPQVYPNTDKRSYQVLNNYSDTSMPLKSIYIIEESNKTAIEDINPKDSLIELVKYSFCLNIFNKNDLSDNLNQCSKIINNILVKKLKIKRSLEDLPKLAETIEKDVLN